jgi:hypothetical protein
MRLLPGSGSSIPDGSGKAQRSLQPGKSDAHIQNNAVHRTPVDCVLSTITVCDCVTCVPLFNAASGFRCICCLTDYHTCIRQYRIGHSDGVNLTCPR